MRRPIVDVRFEAMYGARTIQVSASVEHDGHDSYVEGLTITWRGQRVEVTPDQERALEARAVEEAIAWERGDEEDAAYDERGGHGL